MSDHHISTTPIRRRQKVFVALGVIAVLSSIILRYYSPIFVARAFIQDMYYHYDYTNALKQVCADQHDAYVRLFQTIESNPSFFAPPKVDPSQLSYTVLSESLTNATLTVIGINGYSIGFSDHMTLKATWLGWCVSEEPPVIDFRSGNYSITLPSIE